MPTSPAPDASGSRLAALDALFAPWCRSDAPGLVVGVAQQGRCVYRRGFGLASVESGLTNTPSTRMRIGSTSKQFTCLAALLLAEEGRLDIDASVRRYLPGLPVVGPEPSLRQLMSHTSGYRCYLDLGFIAEGLAIKPAGVAWAVQRRQRAANFAPGTEVIYCNSGYQLLSRVIEEVAGQPFERFLQQRIFAPLGLRDTASVPSDFELHPGTATLHMPRPEGGGWRRGIFPTEELRGEGAMVSTIDDMLRWLAHLRAPQKIVGSAASWAQMLAPTTLANGHVSPYGLGLMRHDYRGVEVIHHAGAVMGGNSQMLSVPSRALDIMIISNGAPCSPRELALRIVDLMLGEQELGAAQPLAAAERFAPLLGRRYRGRDSGLVFGFARAGRGDALGLSLLEGVPMPLRDQGAHLCKPFEEGGIGQFLLPTEPLAGEVPPPWLDLIVSGRRESCELLPATPPAQAGVSLLGRYRCADLDAEARIETDGERLLLQIRAAYGGNRFALQALSAEVFGCQALDLPLAQGGNAVLRASHEAARVSGFFLDTPRTRHLAFERCGD
ncbi:beta-lactamase family protein [Roseateles sp. DAIF2]|uniref:serine hydrolase domain-containing protein n=1 Tax=Roseateles sp. DAIF2 TaxID=2714952 RepID=UPI0018A32633|nr:serine hydrolase domain-containing protein [Roseateles sp. DAIF2]QPF73458.1 beta-lactamase family protein [Roseateles sp. DAIF2]